MLRKYGLKKGSLDVRDLHFRPEATKVPSFVSLREACPPVYDQKDEGSCTANALCAAFDFARVKEGRASAMFSRNFLYWGERTIEGSTGEDAGAEIRDGAKVLNKVGVCLESTWPYGTDTMLKKPSAAAYAEAPKHQATSYLAVPVSRPGLQSCLAAGFPVVIGFDVFAAFESDAVAKSGVVLLPKRGEASIGGHAVLVVGYGTVAYYRQKYAANHALIAALAKQKATALFYEVRNSWGDWGNGGYYLMEAAYLESTKYASDFWTVRVTND